MDLRRVDPYIFKTVTDLHSPSSKDQVFDLRRQRRVDQSTKAACCCRVSDAFVSQPSVMPPATCRPDGGREAPPRT